MAAKERLTMGSGDNYYGRGKSQVLIRVDFGHDRNGIQAFCFVFAHYFTFTCTALAGITVIVKESCLCT